MFVFNRQKILGELSGTENRKKLLTLTSWNNGPTKLDLRVWIEDGGELKACRGITLTEEEAQLLAEALETYLKAI